MLAYPEFIIWKENCIDVKQAANNVNHKIKKKNLDITNTVGFLSGLLSDPVSVCTE